MCVYHVDNVEAGKSHSLTGECLAHMMYECVVHQVTVIGGDANRMAYQKAGQQLNASYGMMASYAFELTMSWAPCIVSDETELSA